MKKKPALLFLARLFSAALFFIAVCLCFSGFPDFSPAVKAQLFPAIDRKAWSVVAAILIFTFLFGRFYCSVICPFGFLQDIIGCISRRKARIDENRPKLRLAVAGAAFASFAAGSTALVALSDPYTLFGRIAAFVRTPAYVSGGVTLAVIIALAVWKKRIFCTSFCPVGAILGILSKISPFKLRLSDRCVKCRKCASVCPAGCINPDERSLDNERCLRCLKCLTVCPTNAIGIAKEAAPVRTDLNRRGFLTGSLTTAAAVGTGIVFARRMKSASDDRTVQKRPICPPGATTFREFASKCTDCRLCVTVCKGKVLRPASKEYQTVHLEYGENHCLYDCRECASVCPTGALMPLSLKEKQNRRIGLAEFSAEKCVGCGLCADVCPRGAIGISEIDGDEKAVLSAQKCIGCGACIAACPLPEKAVSVAPAVIQTAVSK